MIRLIPVMTALMVVSALALAQTPPAAPQSKSQALTAWSAEGLEPLMVKGLDLVYAQPGVSLAGYGKVLLGPVYVDFHRDWSRTSAPGSRTPVSAADTQRIRERLAKLVRDEFLKELAKGGYQVVDAPGEDVLAVDVSVVNLKVNAPDVGVGRTSNYAVSAGEMTLVAALRDSMSGDLLVRVYDRTLAREYFRPQRITSVDNAAEARAAASGWAQALRVELDRAKAGPAKP